MSQQPHFVGIRYPNPLKGPPEPGVTCGWCHQRVPDLNHVVECRRDKGDTTCKRMVSDLSAWVGETLNERSTFVISVDHMPGDTLEVMLDLGKYAAEKYTKVEIDLMQDWRDRW